MKYGRLTKLKDTGKRKWREIVWLCRCDCGNYVEVPTGSLQSGNTRSCGCLLSTHGHTRCKQRSRTYYSWSSMKQRCANQNTPRYKDYGGRGIRVCNRWLKFENFLEDMGEKPEGYRISIDRIDNDGNYEPNNCKWSTPKEQASNRRNNVH